MTSKNASRLRPRRNLQRPRRKKRPEFRIVSQAILAAFHSAPSPDITVGEVTDMALVIIMDDGYGPLEARDAIEHLLDLEDSRHH